MPLLRKTGVRSPWLPAPLQESLERVRPALVVVAAMPALLFGGNVQVIGRLPRDEDTTRPARPVIVVQQPVPPPGAFVWAPRPLDPGVVAQPDRLSPLVPQVNQPPLPGASSIILGMVPRIPNTNPAARPMVVVADPPDPMLVQAVALVVGRLPRPSVAGLPQPTAINTTVVLIAGRVYLVVDSRRYVV